jgi:hypothetical protein
MAQKYRLVPMNNLTQTTQPINHTSSDIAVDPLNHADEETGRYQEIVDLLPKNLRRKAKILLHYLKNQLRLDDNSRIIYADGGQGSHLLDLVKYYTTPRSVKLSRPVDAVKFGLLLKQIGVPDAALGRELILKRSSVRVSASESGLTKNNGPSKRAKFGWKRL